MAPFPKISVINVHSVFTGVSGYVGRNSGAGTAVVVVVVAAAAAAAAAAEA